MAERPGRTAEEREAARRERERQRAATAKPPPPEPDLAAADGDGRYETGEAESGEHELERASGTRRVSHRESLAGRRGRRAPVRPASRETRRRAPRSAGDGSHSWLGRILALGVLGLAAALIWFAVQLFQLFGTSPHGRVNVIVPAKATSSQIGDLLAREGVVSSSFFFQIRATLAGERSSLRAGEYHLQKGMSYGAVLSKLTTAPPAAKVSELTVAEGRRRAQISALLHEQHIPGNYLAATRTTKLLDMRAYGLRHAPPNLEGFLFPDTYQLRVPVTVSALVADQLQDFRRRFRAVNLSYARSHHLTAFDVLIVASLAQAEAEVPSDFPLVASVVYNRLRDNMRLEFDSTTRYATGNYNHPLTVSQLHSSSPWNTHTHAGLPPTPINNPDLAAMQAAGHPAKTNYLYFVSKPCRSGALAFSASYSQFLANVRRLQAARGHLGKC